MQDGYYFATSPWMIGDGPLVGSDNSDATLAQDHLGLRRGQIVRIAPELQSNDDYAEVQDQPSAVTLPIILTESDRYCGDTTAETPIVQRDGPNEGTVLTTVLTEISARQDRALARIEQIYCESVAQLEDRVVAALAANLELTRPHSVQIDRLDATLTAMAQDGAARGEAMQALGAAFGALSTKVDAIPHQSEALLRDVADIRAGLTELRVQARMIEMQLFALSRGTDNPLARPMGIEPLGAMLADTYAN